MKIYLVLFIFALSFFARSELLGHYTKVNEKWTTSSFPPQASAVDHYDAGFRYVQAEEWEKALYQFQVILHHYQTFHFYADALFYSGVCYHAKGDLDFASKKFNQYLLLPGKLKHFDKAFEFKYQIAEAFRKGKKKHLFKSSYLPQWVPAKKEALAIYDEISAALPSSELAAQALFAKADLFFQKRNYKDSIDALQLLTKRFPKHDLAAEAYLKIGDVYVAQSKEEAQNPDLIALAQLNLQRVQKAFPGDIRTAQLEACIEIMKEQYARSLYLTGQFYEKKHKKEASLIYYQDTIRRYPQTEAAHLSEERIIALSGDKKHEIS